MSGLDLTDTGDELNCGGLLNRYVKTMEHNRQLSFSERSPKDSHPLSETYSIPMWFCLPPYNSYISFGAECSWSRWKVNVESEAPFADFLNLASNCFGHDL